MRQNTVSYFSLNALRKSTFLVFSASLLIGTATIAHAQSTSRFQDPLQEQIPAPPLTTSSPYSGSSRQGEYIIPGARRSASDSSVIRKLPPLPQQPRAVTPPPPPARTLPSPRRLSDTGDALSPLHRAETPASMRYIRPSVRTRGTASYPTPTRNVQQPASPSAPLDLQPQAPVETTRTAPAVAPQIPFGQPSAPVTREAEVTIERAIPVESEWQAVAEPTQQTPAPAIPTLPQKQPQPQVMAMPEEAIATDDSEALKAEFDALTLAQPDAATLPPLDDTLPEPLEPVAFPPELSQEPAPISQVDVAEIPSLSEESRKIISATPSGIDTKTVSRSPKPVVIKRDNPSAGSIPSLDVRAHEEMGLKIEIRRPDVNVQSYLEAGYENLINGREAIAAGYYQEVLAVEPRNEMALFGLATTYQRMGKIEDAREVYGDLLSINPSHREALNNFMALISNEAPQEAIAELEALETENPDFSPIPAQLGVVYNRIGNPQMAARKLARALNLSPDNISYKYNLAITLDKLGQWEDASNLYLELIENYNNGTTLPGDIENIRNRVIFINRKG